MAYRKSAKKRLAVFIKFHSSQVLIANFAIIGALLQLYTMIPPQMLADFYAEWPMVAAYKGTIAFGFFVVGTLVSFYKARMNSQVVPRTDMTPPPEETAPVPEHDTKPMER